jgi:DeoR family ulaG and ulaABCDEF operon transcriptional repressor
MLVQAEQKLIGQADELIVLADSSKFSARSSLLLCPLSRIHTVITDEGIDDRAASMLEAADIKLIVARVGAAERRETRVGEV